MYIFNWLLAQVFLNVSVKVINVSYSNRHINLSVTFLSDKPVLNNLICADLEVANKVMENIFE